jgi:hypothetical protein
MRYALQAMKIAASILIFLLLPSIACSQVAVAVSPVPHQQFFDNTTGLPLAAGCLYTYITGTSTPLATYVDSTGTGQNTNPVILGADGGANLWLSNAAYRFTLYSRGTGGSLGSNCFSGTFEYTIDNVSSWTVINNAQNLFLLGQNSDPSGTAGELFYRSDLACFRGFSVFWDCLATVNGVQSFTSKFFNVSLNNLINTTNTAGHYLRNNGTQYVDSAIQIADAAGVSQTSSGPGVGTIINSLAKLNASGNFTVSAITDTGGAIGICTANCSTGSPTIQEIGPATCTFDNAATSTDYVQISSSVAGDCHDSGAAYPASGQVIGRVWTGSPFGGNVLLFGPEIKSGGTSVVFNTPSAASTANIGITTMGTSGASGNTYRFAFYLTQTALGASCTTNTTILFTLTFTDPNGSSASSYSIAGNQMNTSATLATPLTIVNNGGTLGAADTFTSVPQTFRTKANSAVQYQTTYTIGTGCAPGPAYQVYPVLEQIGAN